MSDALFFRVLWVLAVAVVSAPLAHSLAPYQAQLPGAPHTDLSPLDQFVAASPDPANHSRDFELAWEAGIQKMHAGQYEDAANYLQRACERAPGHPTAAFVCTLAFLATGRDGLAATNLRGAIGLYPGWSELSVDLREFFAVARDYQVIRKRLVDAYNNASGGRPSDDVLALLGAIFFYEGEFTKTRLALEMLQSYSPGDRVAGHFLAGLARHGSVPPTPEELGPAPAGTRREPPPEDPFDSGASFLYVGKHQRALERFAEVISRDPAHPYAFFEMAQALFCLGRYSQAATAIRQGLDRNPSILDSGLRRRTLYDQQERLDTEIARLEKAIQESSRDPDLLFLEGWQLFFDDSCDRAVMAMRLVDRLSPGDKHAAMLLQAILRRGTDRAPQAVPEPTPPVAPTPTPSVPDAPPDHGLRLDTEQDRVTEAASDEFTRFRAGDYQGAYTAFLQRQLTAGVATSDRDQIAFMLSAIENGRMRHAIILCDDFLRAHPDPDSLPTDLHTYYTDPADLARTLARVEQYQASPEVGGLDDPGASILLGFLLYQDGTRERAISLFADIAERYPENEQAARFIRR